MRKSAGDLLQIATLSVFVLASACASGQDIGSATGAAPASNEAPPTTAAPLSPAVAPPTKASSINDSPGAVVPIPQQAYRLVVEVGFSGSATQQPALRQEYVHQIRSGLNRMYGAAWNATVRESEWLIPGGKEQLNRLTAEDLLASYPESSVQKALLIGIEEFTGTYQVSCREFDTRIQEMSPVLTEHTSEGQNVANLACRLARDSFRPVLLFTDRTVTGDELEFLLQAGELAVPDPTAAFIREGDVLRTFLRQMDRRNPDRLKSLQRLDLCYVRVTGFNSELRADAEGPESNGDAPVRVDGKTRDESAVYYDSGHVRGVLISHGPVPYGGAGRSVQQIALRQRPAAAKSRVRLVLQNRTDRPLICHRVDKVSKLRHTDENAAPAVRVLTDRNGEIEIEVDPENPTFWLYVYSGSSLLARVPYAPGLIPQDTIKLPDDGLRLGVEGELYLFRDALVDTVAQKAVLMSLAKKASVEGKPDDVDKLVDQLDELPGQKEFMSRLNSIRTPATHKADLQRNAGVKRRIEKLCQAMADSLTAFYSSDNKIREAKELEELRESAERKSAVTPGLVSPAP